MVAALLGLTGAGCPLSHGEAGERGGAIHVEYERVVRRGAMATVTLHLRSASGDVRFWVSAPYFEHVRVDTVAPQPDFVAVEGNRHIYTIRSAAEDVTVNMEVEHSSLGVLEGEVGLVGGPSARFGQLALF